MLLDGTVLVHARKSPCSEKTCYTPTLWGVFLHLTYPLFTLAGSLWRLVVVWMFRLQDSQRV